MIKLIVIFAVLIVCCLVVGWYLWTCTDLVIDSDQSLNELTLVGKALFLPVLICAVLLQALDGLVYKNPTNKNR